jgi:hypothetical protein
MRRLLLSALFVLLATQADATILFAGGEDVDFTCNGSCSVSTGAALFRTGWAREVYVAAGTNVSNDPPGTRFATPVFTPSTAIWLHAQFCNVAGGVACVNTTASNAQMIRLFDDMGNPSLIIRGTGTAGQLKISSRTAGGVFTDLATCSGVLINDINQLDIYVNYDASGTVTIYRGSVQVCTFSGNNTNGDGGTLLELVEFSGAGGAGLSGGWSEVIVATADTRALGLYHLTPNGAGNTVNWSGVNPCTAIVNPTAFNDATLSSSSLAADLLQCTVTHTLPAGVFTVPAVVMAARLKRGATGPQTFRYSTRTGGSDFDNGSDLALTTSFANYSGYVQATNPDTTGAWATTDLTAVGFNIGLLSAP